MNKFYKFLKENKIYLIFSLFLIILNSFFIMKLLDTKYGNINIGILMISSIIQGFIIALVTIFLLKHSEEKKEVLFLKIFIPISILYFILTPMFTIPDEISHFKRTYEISEGKLVSKKYNISKSNRAGNELEKNLSKVNIVYNKYNLLFKNLKYKNTSKKETYLFGNTALYSFVCYIPQTFGVLIGKIISAPILVQAYLGRAFNLITFIILGFFTIKLLPSKKLSTFLILFSPMVIQEANSLSPDALTIAVSAILISYVLNLKYNYKGKIEKKQIMILSALSIVLSLCKIVYLPICLILFLIPTKKFKSPKNKKIIILTLLFISVSLNLLWLSISSSFLPDNSAGVNSSLQLNYIIHNIHRYIYVLFCTYEKHSFYFLESSFGKILGLFSIELSDLYIIPYIIIFIISVIFDNNDDKVVLSKEKINYCLILLIIISTILLISTSLYLQWNAVGNSIIDGIQGRYFIPLLFLLPFLFSKFNVKIKDKNFNLFNKYIILFLVSMNVYTLLITFYTYI